MCKVVLYKFGHMLMYVQANASETISLSYVLVSIAHLILGFAIQSHSSQT